MDLTIFKNFLSYLPRMLINFNLNFNLLWEFTRSDLSGAYKNYKLMVENHLKEPKELKRYDNSNFLSLWWCKLKRLLNHPYNAAQETFTTTGENLIADHERFVNHEVWDKHTRLNKAGVCRDHDNTYVMADGSVNLGKIPKWCIKSECEEVINRVSKYIIIEKESYDLYLQDRENITKIEDFYNAAMDTNKEISDATAELHVNVELIIETPIVFDREAKTISAWRIEDGFECISGCVQVNEPTLGTHLSGRPTPQIGIRGVGVNPVGIYQLTS